MMIEALFVDKQVQLGCHFAQMHYIIVVMNSATLYRTVTRRFLHQEHHATNTGLIQGNNDTPTT